MTAKAMEQGIVETSCKHTKDQKASGSGQHGFRMGKSDLSILIAFRDGMPGFLDKGRAAGRRMSPPQQQQQQQHARRPPAAPREGAIPARPPAAMTKSCGMMKPSESSKSLLAELKIRRPAQRARIPAPFTDPAGTPEPAAPQHRSVRSPRPDPADVDALVPTHDEHGRPIPEWKRQVMVRRLRARLAADDAAGGEVGPQGLGAWCFSPARDAMLGPFGELLTEADLAQLEWQVESLRLRRRGEEYQGELERLAQELRALLPSPLLSITVQSPPPAPGQPLPLWCGRLAGVVSSLALLLANAEGARAAAPPPPAAPAPARPRAPAGGTAQWEIRQCGVSVRSLRGAFEAPAPGPASGSLVAAGRRGNRGAGPSREAPSGFREPAGGESESGGTEVASDSGISCEEGFSDASGSPVPVPVPESASLRKERIVMLFLSHWKRSAESPSLRAAARKTLESQRAQREGARGPKADEASAEKTPGETTKVGHLVHQRNAIQQLIGSWKDVTSHGPAQRRPPGQRGTYSPEQFLPHINGVPADYDSLTLDLFMLGYFRILEQDLSPEERRGRHLLCFEVFDHLGRHSWDTVRAFHRAVTDEIDAGRRGWKDSFEDIKARYFGSTKGSVCWLGSGRGAAGSPRQPAASTPAQSPPPRHHPGCGAAFAGVSNEEICRYIDRSFAFWKEKEAEIFSFEE
ncbi:espin-like protein [Apteryx mantelli]|uniref:Espin-like protein n=1 Tax=Apteryx mantelli TaxID=2696672 RepID=A0ABM4F027_9AVES